jgi:hypothetical protein
MGLVAIWSPKRSAAESGVTTAAAAARQSTTFELTKDTKKFLLFVRFLAPMKMLSAETHVLIVSEKTKVVTGTHPRVVRNRTGSAKTPPGRVLYRRYLL